jgi:hypothetical protein
MARKHYVAMGGSRGCLPDYCEVHTTLSDAVEDLARTYVTASKKALRQNRYCDLSRSLRHPVFGGASGDAAEYCEIQECSCDNPLIHSDCGEMW